MSISAADILAVTKGATKEWTKQRKAEEKGSRSRSTRAYVYSDRVHFTEVIDRILPDAYLKASGGGRLPVAKRQLYYACRQKFLDATGRKLDSKYFSTTLLVQYMNRHVETATWNVTADPRGNLTIPNSGHEQKIPCGTLQIDRFLKDHGNAGAEPVSLEAADAAVEIYYPSLAPGRRYQAVLYIEKEGFEPLLKDAQIGEQFDLAILSCKGQSVVAARKYVDTVCAAAGGVPLFVVHDFDKAGFEISQRLTQVSEWAEENDRVAYQFQNTINVTDLGLRLTDVEEYELEEEECDFSGYFAPDSITTIEEREFLRSGRRVELNAFTSPQFIEWLRARLSDHLKERLIPDDTTLKAAYRRALIVARLNAAIEEVYEEAVEQYADAEVPDTLHIDLEEQLAAASGGTATAWDAVLYKMAADAVGDGSEPVPQERKPSKAKKKAAAKKKTPRPGDKPGGST